MPQRFGYVRVSTREQNEARQLAALEEFHIPPGNLLFEKQSGKGFDRPKWKRLMKRLRPGDLLIVKSIDRLGRDYGEILEEWRRLTKEKAVDILIVDMPLLDTRTQGRDLTGTFIADLVLQILSYVAQTERENIRQRQAEGIAAAKARGVTFGPDRTPPPPGFPEARMEYEAGRLSGRQAARAAGMSKSTFFRRCQQIKTANPFEKNVPHTVQSGTATCLRKTVLKYST